MKSVKCPNCGEMEFSVESTTTEERYVRVPITHPARYRKFFKHRQPTTARKLWKPNAKIEEE
jgi:hypothetical protein